MSNEDRLKEMLAKIEILKNDREAIARIVADPEKQEILTKLESTIERLEKTYE